MTIELYRFAYSCYARKVQAALELARVPFTIVDVPYLDRDVMTKVAPGYPMVPVLRHGSDVITGSREILEALVQREPAIAALVPEGREAVVWAYHDFADSTLETPMFQAATPGIRARFATHNERLFFTFIKERRWGAGCVERWARERDELLESARTMLAPTRASLRRHAFVAGDAPTLADASLYGHVAMLAYADRALVAALGEEIVAFTARMQALGVAPPA
ncbi:glutathione S-transferase family protein [Sandaracinus amylolyticus]|nr:glutathione S-transferase family protein [Sandaracinus amylolyticus]